ncbi:unnamed protein product [Brachionus calyciflorus]|uniref:Uncharacterized protein n=1 Tax=Brachionus calyciflorus TaxID=104777 RepID=A0A814CK78_9BILA|nr:unnamed protein product [Brachionus calyciflorus]
MKYFLFYISLPILKDYLPDRFWNLLALYVISVRIFYESTSDVIARKRKEYDANGKFNDINQVLAEVENYISSREVIPTTSSNSTDDILPCDDNSVPENQNTNNIWNGKNFLDISASSWNKNITALMEVLFTQEEMKTGTVILPGESTKSKQVLGRVKKNVNF